MKLEITCKKCKKDFEIDSKAISRFDLENEVGRYFNKACSSCKANDEYHVNDVYAEKSAMNITLYVVMGFIAIVGLTIFLLGEGIISLVFLILPVFIYFKLKQASEKSVEQFNSHKISTARQI